MLQYNQIKERKYIVLDGDPYEVLESQVRRKQANKPVNQVKMRNLLTGGVKQHSFHTSDTVEEAEIEKKKAVFSFTKENRQTGEVEIWFHADGDRSDRFQISSEIIGDKRKFMKEGEVVDALMFNDQVIGVQLPIKVELKVTEAAPAVKGNTATGATMTVTVETGAKVTTPQFIKEGDILVVKTETGEYVERAK